MEKEEQIVIEETNNLDYSEQEVNRNEGNDSKFESISHTIGNLDENNRKVCVTISLLLKRSINDIDLSLQVGDEMVKFEKNGRICNATIPVDLFLDKITNPVVVGKTKNEMWTETLTEIDLKNLWKNIVPSLYVVGNKGDWSYENNTLMIDSVLQITCMSSIYENAFFEKFTLEFQVGDKVVAQKDITFQDDSSDSVVSCVNEVAVKDDFIVQTDEKLRIYVIAEDSLGYFHRALAYEWFQNADGVTETTFGMDCIYDKEGNLLRNLGE